MSGSFLISILDLARSFFIHLGEERPDTVTYDEYSDWLGHGNNADVLGCPYCGADNTSWMSPDRIHPNAAGYAHIASRWDAELDRMYGSDCAAVHDL
jgi:hypothetical protein